MGRHWQSAGRKLSESNLQRPACQGQLDICIFLRSRSVRNMKEPIPSIVTPPAPSWGRHISAKCVFIEVLRGHRHFAWSIQSWSQFRMVSTHGDPGFEAMMLSSAFPWTKASTLRSFKNGRLASSLLCSCLVSLLWKHSMPPHVQHVAHVPSCA